MTCQQGDKRMEGLKILARMIAAAYRRRMAEATVAGTLPAVSSGEATPADEMPPGHHRVAKGAGTRKRVKNNVNSGPRGEGREN